MEDSADLRRRLRAAYNASDGETAVQPSGVGQTLLRRLNHAALSGTDSAPADALRTLSKTYPGSNLSNALRTLNKIASTRPSPLATAAIEGRPDRIRSVTVVQPPSQALLEEVSRAGAEARASRVKREYRALAALERTEARAEKAEANERRNFMVAVVAAAFGAISAIAAVIAVWPN